MNVTAETDYYHAKTNADSGDRTILLTERGDTVTENIMAAALSPDTTIIRMPALTTWCEDAAFKKAGSEKLRELVQPR